ncbi:MULTISPECIES: IclR family transcriptional regulator [Oceanimonas]|uniref:HTH-type transcriptional repressor AllR n=1 Tax=Oceanimonas baumannii TaxID=129578 RepID=A0A235CMN0_9GAMM|nr:MULTISPECIES: IclR family transcriptional regulator [Oceanimonas]MCC4263279.1 IclR family transcriptional regulator [Oceanimonas baumannii]MDV2856343.1 IclR family transcriptional regulator [Oceanimonas sp. CAM02]OYD25812.1 IclR family transcriptional regulator [Oceanimonas baumannii]TDW60174.1 IclR family transcriptional regulator [Oceanimonas baumannii]
MSTAASTTNSTLLRAFALIETMLKEDRAITAAELCQRLDVPKPTVHRIIGQLEQEGLLQREPDGRYLSPGPRLRKIALGVLAQRGVGAARRAVLQKLADELGETCNIALLDGHELLYFERIETNWPVRIQLHPGSRMPLHSTAAGKLLLALMPTHRRKALLSALNLEPHTPHTITDRERLERELEQIAENTLSIDNEEMFEGMVAIAVPVYDEVGQVRAALAVHAPTARKPLASLMEWAPALRRAAVQLEKVLDL